MPRQAQSPQARSGSRSKESFDARALLQMLAKPRLTGTPGAAEVTQQIRSRLEGLGYEVRDYPFRFSSLPGRFAVSIAGGVYLIGAVLAAGVLYAGHPGIALVTLLVLLLLMAAIAVLANPAMSMLPWLRVEGVNLLAYKRDARPRYLVMAHRDSKSQPIPLAFRGPAIAFAIIVWIALFAAALLALLEPAMQRADVALVLGAIGAISGAILVFCWVDNRSPGALDNASGVATLLGVAEREAAAGDVAFIVTDAEELGLAGARAMAPLLPASFGLINIDGIDDHGGYVLLERFGLRKKKGAAPHLAAAIMAAADHMNQPVRRRDVPFGLLVDHIPVVAAGTPALTLMRGTLSSLRRVHRPADNLDALSGSGVSMSVDLLSDALKHLRENSSRS